MPHCNYNLYNNVLGTNWEFDKLSKLILIGNDFSMYDDMYVINNKVLIIFYFIIIKFNYKLFFIYKY